MKATDERNGLFQHNVVTLARATIVAGFLFCAVSGMAQIPPGYSGPTNTPMASWSFNDKTNWTSDLGYYPISFTNITSSLLGNGSSLVVDTNVPAWLQYNVVEKSEITNLTVDVGSITFWFGPDWSSTNQSGFGPGDWAQLIDVGEWTSDASYGYWGISVDPEGENIYFLAQDGSGDSYSISTPISWTTNDFHFIALTYSSTNVSLYLDGQLATNDPGGLSIWPGPGVLSNGIFFGSDTNGVFQAHGLFDTVETYNYPLDTNSIKKIFDWEYNYTYAIDPYNAPYMSALTSATSSPSYTPTFEAITGPGNLLWVTNVANCIDGSSAYDIWITNVSAKISGSGSNDMSLTFTIEGGSNDVPYDIFANSELTFGTNGFPWAWMGQGYQCNTYMLTNLPSTECFLILGTPQDTTGYGLTDAYELFVLQINPDGPQFDSYGVPYAWYAEHGLSIQSATQDPDMDALLNYQEYLYGTNPQVSEGFAIWVSTPNGTTSIP